MVLTISLNADGSRSVGVQAIRLGVFHRMRCRGMRPEVRVGESEPPENELCKSEAETLFGWFDPVPLPVPGPPRPQASVLDHFLLSLVSSLSTYFPTSMTV